MSNYRTYQNAEQMKQAYQITKGIAILQGASDDSFIEADKKIDEIYKAAKSKVMGGIVTPITNEEGEAVINRGIIESATKQNITKGNEALIDFNEVKESLKKE